ncbi:IS630 family transposase [Mesorhizobium sp. VK24D]|uniref:IS630 family transposase n=1 Tax=Mesorhizobium album TaxID=3072314 RepID=A0ABU4Y6L9_9HYPH|nr:IS630 family transposase [Mesorhizobium sp. VK24D]MDX8481537.1 IS630 family transposase [Mesorhizobium sp. VK24D]
MSIAAVLDGMSRADAARIGGMDRQTLRDWVHRFNTAGPDGLLDQWSPGPPSRLSPVQQAELAVIVETGPDRAADGVVRWRRIDLKRVIRERFGGLRRALCRETAAQARLLAYQRPPAASGAGRPYCRGVQKNWPRTLKAHLCDLPPRTKVELWFQDEARIGQKNGTVRQWARRGTRPRQPADQRYKSAYLFGAICPARGAGAALALPFADTEAMQLHIDEISRHVEKGAHAVLIMDRAGWHTTANLRMPENITPIFLPSRAPGLNPVENVWQYLRQNWISNRVFDDYEAIIDAASEAWQKLIAAPETITSIGTREWAHVGQTL